MTLHHATFETSWTPEELERSGLLADVEPPPPPLQPVNPNTWRKPGAWKFPDWQKCTLESLAAGVRKKDDTVDHSDVDWRFACLSKDWKIPPDEVVADVSRYRDQITPDKLRKNPNYARLTVGNAYGVLL